MSPRAVAIRTCDRCARSVSSPISGDCGGTWLIDALFKSTEVPTPIVEPSEAPDGRECSLDGFLYSVFAPEVAATASALRRPIR